ncbi:hypothetical protein SAMN00790413_03359 [Deinococcus hopiensis KR-140]|uniref:Uncharacterized protein n=1 Tax=Deinococcus hopiensis KR-140 TaxID=695939 RepID=A0A1W1UVY0_9DEIO|nr:hypothetical protein SAMN00790413_03359 [Deinococcus hopiensis KR-140]
MPIGEFVLARQGGGRGHYGKVAVEVEPASQPDQDIIELSEHLMIRGNGFDLAVDQARD